MAIQIFLGKPTKHISQWIIDNYVKPEINQFVDYKIKIFAKSFDNTKFEKIQKKDVQFLEIDANYTGSYSASIGYDRKEQYIDHEKHYDYQLQREVTKEVVKERTVTDWRPISGPVSSYEKSFVHLERVKASDYFMPR